MFFFFLLTLPDTEGNCFLDSTAPDCTLCILFFLIQNNSAFIRFVLSLILLQSFLHCININSPDSLFCLVVFIYHRLFSFPFLSRPREMSSSAIKSESFSKEALQPRDVGAIFLLRVVVVLFSVFLPLHFLMPEPGSDFTHFLGGDFNALKTCSLTFFSCLPWADILDLSFIFVPMLRYQTALPHAFQTQNTVPRQPVVLLWVLFIRCLKLLVFLRAFLHLLFCVSS